MLLESLCLKEQAYGRCRWPPRLQSRRPKHRQLDAHSRDTPGAVPTTPVVRSLTSWTDASGESVLRLLKWCLRPGAPPRGPCARARQVALTFLGRQPSHRRYNLGMDSDAPKNQPPLSPAEAVRLAAARILSSPEEKRAFMMRHGLLQEESPAPPESEDKSPQ